MSRRRRSARPAATAPPWAGPDDVTVTVVVIDDRDRRSDAVDAAEIAECRRALRAIVDEAVIWQGEAGASRADGRARESMPVLAPRSGRLVSRFVALRERLPRSADPDV